MFCSKCGAQNVDGAAVCNSCGSKLLAPDISESTQNSGYQPPHPYSQQPQSPYPQPMQGGYQQQYHSGGSGFIKGEPEEIQKKKNVLICFLINSGVTLLFFLVVLISKFSLFVDLLSFNSFTIPKQYIIIAEELYPEFESYIKERIAEEFNNEFASWRFIFLLIFIVADVIQFIILRKGCADRQLKGSMSLSSFSWSSSLFLILLIYIPIVSSKFREFGISPSFMYYFICAAFLAGQIIYIVLCRKAVDVEEYYKFKSPQEPVDRADWRCPNCGSQNMGKDIFCQSCEKNKPNKNGTGGSAADVWICKECGERNPKSSTMCRGCGKYK